MPEDDANALDFLVRRDDLRECRFAPAPSPDDVTLAPGQALLEVERFGFSANNVTYAAFGDAMRYWEFFPAPEGWGRVPVWGFARVARSAHAKLQEGERVFGYLPMSTHLVVAPDGVSAAGFADGSPHRAPLPGAYQLYRRLAGDPGHDTALEAHQALLRPLFLTSVLIEDFLAEGELFGAQTVVLASASSKTALGVAFLLSRREPRDCQVVGLTSPGNREFCEQSGYYDAVLPYGEVEALAPREPTVLVDMAGDGGLLHDVHHHLGDALRHSCIVGATHWEARATQHDLPGPAPQFFFAPDRIRKRVADWGPGGVARRFDEALSDFLPSVKGWMRIVAADGAEAVEAVYRDMLEGRVDPSEGHMLSLSPENKKSEAGLPPATSETQNS